MDIINPYQRAQEEMASYFQQLPMAKRLLVHLLMIKADPETGIVDTTSYDDLSSLIQVQKNTVKNYIATLASRYPHDIEIMSLKDSVKIKFVKMAKTTSQYFNPDLYEQKTSPIKEVKFFIKDSVEKTYEPISPSYYPCPDTILRGKKKGLEHITNQKEIDAFIDYHQKNNMTWENYNDIYLIWLYYGEHYRTKVASCG